MLQDFILTSRKERFSYVDRKATNSHPPQVSEDRRLWCGWRGISRVRSRCPSRAGRAKSSHRRCAAVNTGAKQTVRYLSWWFEEGNRGKTWQAFIKEFNESQKDIEVMAENIPFDAYTTKTIVGAQSGKLDGDIVMATPELAPRLIKADLLAPLDDVLTRNNITDLSSAHDALRKDGKLYGLDMVTVAFGILYNSKRYEEAKITPSQNPG